MVFGCGKGLGESDGKLGVWRDGDGDESYFGVGR